MTATGRCLLQTSSLNSVQIEDNGSYEDTKQKNKLIK